MGFWSATPRLRRLLLVARAHLLLVLTETSHRVATTPSKAPLRSIMLTRERRPYLLDG